VPGRFRHIVTNRYDAFGNLADTRILDAQDAILAQATNAYDANGNWVRTGSRRTRPGGATEWLVTTMSMTARTASS